MSGRSSFITRWLIHDAVYWGTPTPDGYGGNTFADPVDLKVRWDEKQEQFTDVEGLIAVSAAVVLAGQDLDINGYLALGTVADLESGHDEPQTAIGAQRVRSFSKASSVGGGQTVRLYYLGGR